jgi:hypothetical protein
MSVSHPGTCWRRFITLGVMMDVMMVVTTDRMQTVAAYPYIFHALEAVIGH